MEEIELNLPKIIEKNEKLKNGNVIEIQSNEEFEKITSSNSKDQLIILYFHSTISDSCKFMNPIYSKESVVYPTCKFIKIDSDKHSNVTEFYQISSLPSFIFTKKNEEIDRLEGVNQTEFLTKLLNHSSH